MRARYFNLIFVLSALLTGPAFSQDTVNQKRLKPLLITSAVVYTGTMAALSQTWYKEHERTSFHFFNDNDEWKQVDKAGHFWTAYHLSAISYEGFRWTGMKAGKATLWGATAGLIMIMPVEWLDGYSAKYGASTGDIIANFAGTAFFVGQQLIWQEGRIIPKFSFHRTSFAPMRPEVLGDGLSEEWLKDYNGQTYWLSFDTDKFVNSGKRWLDYINIAVGYGANGMIYAHDRQNIEAGLDNRRQYYLALDLDLTAIRTNKTWLKRIIYIVNSIHLPAPTLSFSGNEWKIRMFYF